MVTTWTEAVKLIKAIKKQELKDHIELVQLLEMLPFKGG